jgi:hypothetical protein
VPAETRVATARLRLLFPDDRIYTLASTSVEFGERLYVNGEWRLDVGSPGLTADTSTAASGFNFFDVKPVDGLVEIVRQGNNHVHKEGAGYIGVFVGSPANIRQMAAAKQVFTSINIGLFLGLFLLHLLMFLFLRSYRANLWFALLCFVWMVRAGFTGHYAYWVVFPGISWELMYKLGCVSIALTGMLLLLLVRDYFPGLVQKWPLRAALLAQAVFIALFLIFGTVTVSHIKTGSEILLYVTAIYLVVRLCLWLPKRVREKGLGSEYLLTLAGVGVAVAALLHDVLRYNNVGGGLTYEIGEVGMAALMLFQMCALMFGTMRRYSDARQEADAAMRKAEELAEKAEFFHKMAHGLLTPLTRVSTSIQLAEMAPEEAGEFLKGSQDDIMVMADMINEALEEAGEDEAGKGESGGGEK